MEDQFGGRTDDDLFYDDFEPVDSETVVVAQPPSQPAPEPAVTAKPAEPKPSQQNATPKPTKGLASSRYADKPAPAPSPPAQAPPPPAAAAAAPPPVAPAAPAAAPDPVAPVSTAPANAPTAPKEKQQQPRPAAAPVAGQNTAGDAKARIGSGANPRQKLTEEELAAKMEKMKLLSAERTRKFEMAEKDEKQHAQAYARGMEEARKRRAEDAERRRRGEEDRRRMEDERAKNRERKLKAMGAKEGGWDEGKEAMAEEESRRGFRGANGGIRGAKSGGGLGGSRYARQGDEPDVDRFLDERHRGRGRGRGGGGRGGRGGRGGAHEGAPPKPAQAVPTVEDFPALPSAETKVETTNTAPKDDSLPTTPSLSLPPGGKWDDEMEAMDELKQAKS